MLGIKIHNHPKLESPNMLAALPDMGNVAGIGVSYIIKKLNAKLSEAICSINAIKGVYFGSEKTANSFGSELHDEIGANLLTPLATVFVYGHD